MKESNLPAQELKTVRDFIRWGASYLGQAKLTYGHGTDNALDEAACLVLHAVHLPHDIPDHFLDGVLTQTERQKVLELLQDRVATRRPAAYLIHEAWFAGLRFYVDESVLVPRSPLAELIGNNLAPWVEEGRVRHILDLCTGSGCIGIACAVAFPDAWVDAVDISPEALSVARRNVAAHHLEDRVRIIQSDLFTSLDDSTYDVIISNPPYVPHNVMAELDKEYRHEPVLGLVAGEDGLDIIRRILSDAAAYLNEDGVLIVEVGDSQEMVLQQFPEIPFLWLEFEHGGHGVFLLEKEQLIAWQA